MATSKLADLEWYDENSLDDEEFKSAEYYRIDPEEIYVTGNEDDIYDDEFEDKLLDELIESYVSPSQEPVTTSLQAVINHEIEMVELLKEFKTSHYQKLDVEIKLDICFMAVAQLSDEFPILTFIRSGQNNGYCLFKIRK